ncbi:hypothetical protein Mal65_01730 [Crateriforma conspicua]|nr:hypothetical protein Mal65_01730 [Crateriforma conspicua]
MVSFHEWMLNSRSPLIRTVMPADVNWREIIKRYLEACLEDQQVGARAETHTHRMLMSFGSHRLVRKVKELRADCERRSRQPLGLMEGYTLVQECRDFVIAEVDRCDDGQPPFQSRYRLVHHDDEWFLDDVYWACHCDNGQCYSCDDGKCKHCSDGKCSHCDGKGYCRCWVFFTHSCILCDGSGACFLCQGKGTCDSCDGLGRCPSCASSDMPGWTSVYQRRLAESEHEA